MKIYLLNQLNKIVYLFKIKQMHFDEKDKIFFGFSYQDIFAFTFKYSNKYILYLCTENNKLFFELVEIYKKNVILSTMENNYMFEKTYKKFLEDLQIKKNTV